MDKLVQGKFTVTMKEALVRNTLAVNKMKADLDAIDLDTKKTLQSLDHHKQKYEKRQRELQIEKQWAQDRAGSRKISAPSRLMVPNIDGTVLSSSEILTDLTELQRIPCPRPRSRSLLREAVLPPLVQCESSEKLPDIVQPKGNGPALPYIDASNGRRPRLNSASNLNGKSVSSGLTAPAFPKNAQSRSAPGSPCMTRRAEVIRGQSTSGHNRSPMRNMSDALVFLDDIQKKKVLDFEEVMAKLKDVRHTQEEERKTKEQNEMGFKKTEKELASMNIQERKDNPRSRKISSPGRMLHPPGLEKDDQSDSREGQQTLGESMNDIRYCKYLRTSSLDEELLNQERIPNELVPKVIIVGHTEWVSGD